MVPLRRIITLFLTLCLLVASTLASQLYFQHLNNLKIAEADRHEALLREPPIKYLSIAMLNKDMLPGETLRGRVTIDRRRNCPAISKRSITQIKENGEEEIIFTDNADQVTTIIGESVNLIFTMKLPKLPPGCYVFRSIGRHDCDGRIFTIEVPTAGFCIVGASK